MDKWISVNENFPPKKELVIIYGGSGYMGFGWYYGKVNGFDRWYIDTDKGEQKRGESFVRWWMSKPEKPEGEM